MWHRSADILSIRCSKLPDVEAVPQRILQSSMKPALNARKPLSKVQDPLRTSTIQWKPLSLLVSDSKRDFQLRVILRFVLFGAGVFESIPHAVAFKFSNATNGSVFVACSRFDKNPTSWWVSRERPRSRCALYSFSFNSSFGTHEMLCKKHPWAGVGVVVLAPDTVSCCCCWCYTW